MCFYRHSIKYYVWVLLCFIIHSTSSSSSWCLRMGPIGCSETSVQNYHCIILQKSTDLKKRYSSCLPLHWNCRMWVSNILCYIVGNTHTEKYSYMSDDYFTQKWRNIKWPLHKINPAMVIPRYHVFLSVHVFKYWSLNNPIKLGKSMRKVSTAPWLGKGHWSIILPTLL